MQFESIQKCFSTLFLALFSSSVRAADLFIDVQFLNVLNDWLNYAVDTGRCMFSWCKVLWMIFLWLKNDQARSHSVSFSPSDDESLNPVTRPWVSEWARAGQEKRLTSDFSLLPKAFFFYSALFLHPCIHFSSMPSFIQVTGEAV